jgi:hypothetical protein
MKKVIALIIVANLGWTLGYAKNRTVDTESVRKSGTETGNGGDVRVCFNSKATKESVERILKKNIKEGMREDPFSETVLSDIRSVELLDLYILSRKMGGRIAALQGNEEQIINDRLGLFESKSQFVHEILDAKRQIDSGGWYSAESGVLEIDDSGEPINYSDKCILIQLAYQDRISRTITRVFYDERILRLMPELHRAAFKFHEWIYHIAVDRGYSDSRSVQDVVGMIFDEGFSAMTAGAVNRRIQELGLSAHTIRIVDDNNVYYLKDQEKLAYPSKVKLNGNEFEVCDSMNKLCSPKPITQGEFQGVMLGGPNLFYFDSKTGFFVSGTFEKGAKWKQYTFDGPVVFDVNGNVESGILAEAATVGRNKIDAGYGLVFDKSGIVTQVFGRENSKSTVWLQLNGGAMISCRSERSHLVDLYPETGDVSSCHVGARTVVDGVNYSQGEELAFYPSGAVKSGKLAVDSIVQGVTCGGNYPIHFYESKRIKSCRLTGAQEHSLGLSGERMSFNYGEADFYDGGGVHCAELDDNFWSKTFTRQNYVWRYRSGMCFYKDGKIESGQLGKSVTTSDGRIFDDYSRVQLSPDGQIVDMVK